MLESNAQTPRRVILVEMNEITWRLIDPLLATGKLPAFADFLRHGTKASPIAPEVPPNLDPWISWTTVYTGRPQSEHGVRFLEQPPESVTGPRIWELAADAGKTIGVYGSIMSWPPRKHVLGFWVPSTFSPSPETVPATLQPIQDLNLSHTRAHSPVLGAQKKPGTLMTVYRLWQLGLRCRTLLRVAGSLARWLVRPHRKWEKVSLQQVINLDFFEHLYKQYQPDLATFHTNHVAHYQHRYWRSMDPAPFLIKPTATEQQRFGKAIEFGYQIADEALQRIWEFAGPNTVVIVASGLGQQPYVDEAFPDGRKVVRIRDINQILALCGISTACNPISMMAPQWLLRFSDAGQLAQAERSLRSVRVGTSADGLFAVETVGNTINFNIRQRIMLTANLESPCMFPETGKSVTLGELCDSGRNAQGRVSRSGRHVAHARSRRCAGAVIRDCSTLDLAPTILHLLGLPIPQHMKGHILQEAFSAERPQAAHGAANEFTESLRAVETLPG